MTDKRPRMARPLPLSQLLEATFQGKPAGKRLKEGRIWLIWESAVGPQIATHASPASFRDGTLTVAVDSAPWMQQLNFMKVMMKENLNRRLGEELVTDLYLKAGKVTSGTAKPKQQKPAPAPPLSAADKARISEATGTVADEELRQRLAGLMARHLSHRE